MTLAPHLADYVRQAEEVETERDPVAWFAAVIDEIRKGRVHSAEVIADLEHQLELLRADLAATERTPQTYNSRPPESR